MPERNCASCTKQAEWGCEAERFPSNEDDPEAIPDRKGKWWRWSKPAHMPILFDEDETYACPRQDVFRRGAEWGKMLLYYGFYQKGHLPQAGAIMDQSAKAMEIFRVLDDANRECDAALIEKERKGPKGQPGHGRQR